MTDLARVVEDALDARTVPWSPDAAVWVVDSGAPEAIVAALLPEINRHSCWLDGCIRCGKPIATCCKHCSGWRDESTPLGDIADT